MMDSQLILADRQVSTPKPDLFFFFVICLLAAAIPNDSLLGGYDLASGRGLRSPSYYVGVVASIISLAFIPQMFRAFFRSTPMVLATAAFTICIVVLSGFVLAGDASFRAGYQLDRQFKSIFMAVLILVAAERPVWRRRIISAYFAGSLLLALIVIFLVLSGQAATMRHQSGTRTSVLGMNENVQSTLAAACAILALVRSLLDERRRWILVWGGIYLVSMAAFVLGASRTALAAVVAGHLIVLAFTFSTSSRRQRASWLPSWVKTPAIVFGLTAMTLIAANRVDFLHQATDAMESRSESALEGHDLGMRDVLAEATLRIFIENPAGVGAGRSMDMLQGYDPHNGYLKLAAEGGVASLLLFLLAMVAVGRHAIRWVRLDPLEIGTVAGLVIFAISAATGQALAESPFWVFFGLLAIPPPTQRVVAESPRLQASNA